ncbi:MAG: HepT-like ribonuclease domain-containing protein [Methanoregulaceae archaeon]
MRPDRERLKDILDAVRNIQEKIPAAKDEFLHADLIQVWVLYHIQIIGEAANGISPEFRSRHPDVPWKDIIAMRHFLVHQYFGIDVEEVWNTAARDLPDLAGKIRGILEEKEP